MAAGDAITILKPKFRLGELYPTAAVLPALTLAKDAAWPANWQLIRGYVNGVQVTYQNPKVAIGSSDLGILAYVGSGAHGQQMQIQFRRPTAELIQRLGSLYKVTKTGAELFFQDATDEIGAHPSSEFRVGIEGIANAHGLYTDQKITRFVGLRAQQGGNFVARWDHTGNDAGIFPTMTAQLLPYTPSAGELTGTGMDAADFKDDKSVWIMSDVA